MKSFWNQRYGAAQFAYGVEPNKFYKEQINRVKPGKVLFPGEGEGRNAVYAATLGWDVTAFDSAENGKIKADMLADLYKVKIDYIVDDAEDVVLRNNYFDCIVFVFVHLPMEERQLFHRKMLSKLKPGGLVIFEGFAKKQLEFNSGGPRNLEMLFSKKEIWEDFSSQMQELNIQELEVKLYEGEFHQGISQVIRFVARKIK
ncbi:MAG: SAM-dependent methyltransferase [Bacteroidetes bacterium HGW-Bacteroidetes-16]|jgi:2-polyprenyl-3-methyl-5-hydroxy-6-metoxy-1,4-benzoquinol methylase|nr:MAG: SAM-dependent methyltransferase [Bacteroidetes bacterium HGW-Bacteroidetes-16]